MKTWLKENKTLTLLNAATGLALALGWSLYMLFGYPLIKAMYKGESIKFLNSIIEGQSIHPLAHYFEDADWMMRLISLTVIGLSSVLTLLIKTLPLLVSVGERVNRYVGRLVNVLESAAHALRQRADPLRNTAITNKNDILISVAIAALFHLGYFYYMNNPANRYSYNWQHEHAFFFVLNLVLLALALTAISLLLKRSRNKYLFNMRYGFLMYAFVIAGLSAFKVPSSLVTYIWGAGLIVSVFVCIRPIQRLIAPLKIICLVLSPLGLVLAINVFLWPERGQTAPPRPRPQIDLGTLGGGLRVYMFIFDEWSYSRLTTNNEVRKTFRNIRELSGRSLFFRNAYSPAAETKVSMPRILFQTNDDLVEQDAKLYWNSVGPENTAKSKENLFRPFRAGGFFNVLIGYGLPYHELLEKDVHYIKTLRHDPVGRAFLEKMLVRSIFIVANWVDPVSKFLFGHAYPWAFIKNKREIDREIRKDFAFFHRNSPVQSFQLYHWALPHGPFVFNADGSDRSGPYWGLAAGELVEGYDAQQHFLDETIGWIVRSLRETGQFESSLIIMTSDHGWRLDPDLPDYKKNPRDKRYLHVPLIIKWPGQSKGAVIEREYHLTDLHQLLEKALKGTKDVDVVVESLKRR